MTCRMLCTLLLVVALVAPPSSIHAQPTLSAIYVTDTGNHRLVRVSDMTGAGWTTLGDRRLQFATPIGIALDPAGRIYVADSRNSRVVRVNDMTGAGWAVLKSDRNGRRQFFLPTEVAVDAAGRIYIADSDNFNLVRVNDMTGAGWTALGPRHFRALGGSDPYLVALALDRAGRIYVVFQVGGALYYLRRVNGMAGTGLTELANRKGMFPDALSADPEGIAVDRAGRIYLTDTSSHRIVRVNNLSGAGWITLGREGEGVKQFKSPEGIAVDAAGRIYVVDTGNHRIVRMDNMMGAGWTTLGTNGEGVMQFKEPKGIVLTPVRP